MFFQIETLHEQCGDFENMTDTSKSAREFKQR